jgi:hypothetical protein
VVANQSKKPCDCSTVEKSGTPQKVLTEGKQELFAPFNIDIQPNAH